MKLLPSIALLLIALPAHAQKASVRIGASFSTAEPYATIRNGALVTDLPMPDEERALLTGGSGAHPAEFEPDETQTITIHATVYGEADYKSLEECIRTTDRNKRAECAEIVEGIEPGAGESVQPEPTINTAPSGSGEKEKE